MNHARPLEWWDVARLATVFTELPMLPIRGGARHLHRFRSCRLVLC